MKWRIISENEVRGTVISPDEIEYDNEVDTLYIKIQEEEVSHTKELEEGVNLDLDESNKIIG